MHLHVWALPGSSAEGRDGAGERRDGKIASTGVRSYFEGQFPLYCIEKFFVDDIAKIVGAKPLEVTVMNSSTINSHLGMVSYYSWFYIACMHTDSLMSTCMYT